jgi:hypothetical protein
MKQQITHVVAAVLAAIGALAGAGSSVRAATPESYAGGQVRTVAGLAQFAATLDGAQAPYFELWESSGGQTRTISLAETTEVACLGDLFGGQTVSLTGTGWDSSAGGERLSIQAFLVDGGGSGPDRLSVKVRRADERVLYFLPMRDIESGDIWVSC